MKSRKRGRPAAAEKEDILIKLVEENLYESNGELKKRSNIVWDTVCKSLGHIINPVNLYNMVRQNRNTILNDYCMMKNIPFVTDKVRESDSKYFFDDENEGESESPSPKKARTIPRKGTRLTFEISLSKNEWDAISPIKEACEGERTALRLKEGWTDTFRTAIWRTKKLPCAYSFERYQIDNCTCYLKAEGHCTTTLNPVNIILKEKPIENQDNEAIKFQVVTIDCSHIAHTKKTKLKNNQKQLVEKELVNQRPKQWRRENAKILMNHGDVESPQLYSLTQLQTARQDGRNKKLGIAPGVKLFDSLEKLKASVDYNKFIKHIGYDKFYVIYFSPEQTDICNDILTATNNPLYLDSTGSIACKINRPNGDSSDIFLTILCTHIGSNIVPLAQVLSEKNDTCFFIYWLHCWLQSGAKIPREVNTDRGKGLQNSVTEAFNSVNFSMYNDLCLRIVIGEDIGINLRTQLRTDVAHVLRSVTQWPCLKNKQRKVGLFYKKCIGFMTTIDKLTHFTTVLMNIFIVENSQYCTTGYTEAMDALCSAIKTFSVVDSCSDSEKNSDDHHVEKLECVEKLEDVEDEKRLTYAYVKRLEEIVKDKIAKDSKSFIGIQENDYFLPELSKPLIDLCKEFPCWTNIMNFYFDNPRKVSSSARSETLFGQTKADLEKICQRVDKVLIKHCSIIEADIILARAELENFKKKNANKPKGTKEKKYDVKSCLRAIEIWHNKNTQDISGQLQFSDLQETIEPIQENGSKIITDEAEIEEHELNVQVASTSTTLPSDHTYSNFTANLNLQSTLLQDSVNPVDCKLDQDNSKKQDNTETKKSRGFYVTPDPEIDMLLQIPNGKNKKSKSNIQNGNKLKPIKINKKKIFFSNTCAFDTIMEIMSNGCCFIQEFNNFNIENKNELLSQQRLCFATMISNYSLSGICASLYSARAYLLQSLFPVKNDIINCETNIATLFERLMSNYNCTKKITKCTLCNVTVEDNVYIIPLPNIYIVWKHQYANLESELNNYLQKDIVTCHNCQFLSSSVEYRLGPYLWIDTDDAYVHSSLAKENKLPENSLVSNLNDVPEKISIAELTYHLCGVVKYVPPLTPKGTGHYIAFCRQMNGNGWKERNDLLKRYKLHNAKSTAAMKMSSIFYVKCTV